MDLPHYKHDIVDKGVTAGNFLKNSAKKFNENKYSKISKKEGSKFLKTS